MGHPPATHCRSGRGWQTMGTQGRVNRRRAAAGAQGEITSHEIVATVERGRKAALASMPGTEQLSARPCLTLHQTDWPVPLSAASANGEAGYGNKPDQGGLQEVPAPFGWPVRQGNRRPSLPGRLGQL